MKIKNRSENKIQMTLDTKRSILERFDSIKSDSTKRKYLESLQNKYHQNVFIDKEKINRRYPNVNWNDITIGVDILLDDDLSIQSKEIEILYDYKELVNENKTKQRNTEDLGYTSINLDVDIDTLIELHNKQLNCVVNICKDIDGNEVIVDVEDDLGYILDEDLYNFFSVTLTTTFIKQLQLWG